MGGYNSYCHELNEISQTNSVILFYQTLSLSLAFMFQGYPVEIGHFLSGKICPSKC